MRALKCVAGLIGYYLFQRLAGCYSLDEDTQLYLSQALRNRLERNVKHVASESEQAANKVRDAAERGPLNGAFSRRWSKPGNADI